MLVRLSKDEKDYGPFQLLALVGFVVIFIISNIITGLFHLGNWVAVILVMGLFLVYLILLAVIFKA
jgi:hypothetical protein